MEHDTNRLSVDGVPFTPVGWQVRQVLDVTDTDVLAVVSRTPETAGDAGLGTWDDADLHDARSCDVVSFDYHGGVTQWTSRPGVWTASRAGKGMVISGRDMCSPYAGMHHSLRLPETVDPIATAEEGQTIMTGGSAVAGIANHAADPGITPNTRFVTLPSEHRLLAAITAPSESSPYAQAESLPVLLKPYGGPGAQQVLFSQSYYWESQWWADQGFLVVTVDGRGTPGRGPQWDRAIYETMKDVTLADQVEAVRALPALWSDDTAVPSVRWTPREGAKLAVCGSDVTVPQLDIVRRNDLLDCPKPDLDKVAMIGWSYGGFLSALAVLDAPDVVHAACAGAPPTDWTLYDTHYTERYLGLDPEVYRRNGIVEDAPKLRRPLMLIHGFADDNVTIAHSLRLSQALMAAGRPHTFLPLTGITHMTNDETVAETCSSSSATSSTTRWACAEWGVRTGHAGRYSHNHGSDRRISIRRADARDGAARACRLLRGRVDGAGPGGGTCPSSTIPVRCTTCATTPRSSTICARTAPQPRSVAPVVISYGFTENARKYSELIWYFLLDGYSVCVLEHRGHGYSVRDVDDPRRGVDRRLAAVRGRPGQVRRNRWTEVRGGPPDGAVRAFDGRRHRGGRVGAASDAVRQGGALLPDDRPGDRRHPQHGGGGRSRGRLPHGIREEPGGRAETIRRHAGHGALSRSQRGACALVPQATLRDAGTPDERGQLPVGA